MDTTNHVTDGTETTGAAARRYAGELERLGGAVAVALEQAGIDEATLTTPVPRDEWAVTAAIALIETLLYERSLLGRARRILDEVADPEQRRGRAFIANEAAECAQRIVDEIGHPVTDEPPNPLVRRLTEAETDRDRFKADYLGACGTIAAMHAAATGRTGQAPHRGVVDDVEDVATELRTAKAHIAVLEQELATAHALRDVMRLPTMGDPPPPPTCVPPLSAAERVDLTAVTTALEPVRDSLDAVPSLALLADMARIAGQFRGVEYDAHDRPAEVLAVRRAAIGHGLIPVPSDALLRTYRGCTPPVPPPTPAAVGRVALADLDDPYTRRRDVREALAADDPIEVALTAIRPALAALVAATRRPRPRAATQVTGPGACGQDDCQHAPDGGNHPAAGGTHG